MLIHRSATLITSLFAVILISALAHANASCHSLFSSMTNMTCGPRDIHQAILLLAKLRIKLDVERADGDDSIVHAALEHDYKIKEAQMARGFEELKIMTRSDLKKRIEAAIEQIQNADQVLVEKREHEQTEKRRQQQDVNTRTLFPTTERVIEDGIRAIFSPSGSDIYVFSRQDVVRRMSVKTNIISYEQKLPSHPESFDVIADNVLMGFIDGKPRRLNVTKNEFKELTDTAIYRQVALTSDKHEITIVSGKTVTIKNLHDGKTRDILHFDGFILKTMVSEDASHLYVVTQGEQVTDATGRLVHSNCVFHTIDIKTLIPVSSFPLFHGAETAAIDSSGKQVAIGNFEGVFLYDAETGKELKKLKQNYTDVTAMVFTRDGKTLITGSEHGLISYIDVADFSEVTVMNGSFYVLELTLSPNGRSLVATGQMDQLLFINLYGLPNQH